MLLLTALQVLTLGRDLPPISPDPAPQAGTPHLTHSAPFVGQTLTIHVDGAPAQARVDLYLSPTAGTYATPYGNLELGRAGLHEVASGITSATGTWSVDFPVPLDTSLAETEQHFQAIVDDVTGPTGRVISDALHIRLLGPRVYASVGASYGFPGSPALEIVSGTTESVVASVELGPDGAGYPGGPVFEASYARGAVMCGGELVFFDPFFGGVLQRIPFATGCAASLTTDSKRENVITDSAHETIFVLDTGPTGNGRIHAIDFASGTETASFDLPNPVATWCYGMPGTDAYVAEMDLGQTSVRHVSLEPFADLGSTVVGTPFEDMGFENMIYADGQVFASTLEWPYPQHGVFVGCLTRCRFSGSSIETSVEPLGLQYMSILTPVPEVDRLLAGVHPTNSPGGGLVQMPLSAAGPIEVVPEPPIGCCFYPRFNMNADGKSVWAILWDDEDSVSALFRLDLESMTWISYPQQWHFDPPAAADLLRDAWDHEYWVANYPTTFPRIFWPELRVVDELLSTTRHIRLDRTAFGLFAVPLP